MHETMVFSFCTSIVFVYRLIARVYPKVQIEVTCARSLKLGIRLQFQLANTIVFYFLLV